MDESNETIESAESELVEKTKTVISSPLEDASCDTDKDDVKDQSETSEEQTKKNDDGDKEAVRNEKPIDSKDKETESIPSNDQGESPEEPDAPEDEMEATNNRDDVEEEENDKTEPSEECPNSDKIIEKNALEVEEEEDEEEDAEENLENKKNEEKDGDGVAKDLNSPLSDDNSQEDVLSKGSPSTQNEEVVNEENSSKDDKESSIPDIEEVDANVSISKPNQEEEEDVLSDDRTQTAEKQKSPQLSQMDVDAEESDNKVTNVNDDTLDETSKTSDIQDTEMRSVESGEPAEKEKSPEPSESEKSKKPSQAVEIFDCLRKSTDIEPMEVEDNESQDYLRNDSANKDIDETDNLNDAASQSDQLDNIENEAETSENPTENVQEEAQGESADICLIPDNDEELTGAEKEQAILARQNAEKEEAEKEEAEKEASEKTIGEDKETTQNEEVQDAEENIVEPDPSDAVVEIDDETESSESNTKTVIFSILHSDQFCVECKSEKSCEFRYKNEESESYLYVCGQECCDSLVNKENSNFIIRKRKYIVEDLPEPKTEECFVCKEEKVCKLTFKADENTIFICSDECYDTLSKNEPDKLKLKRTLIRVKNLSVTIQNVAATTPETVCDPKIIARTAQEAELAKLSRDASFERRCASCCSLINSTSDNLLWETHDFCNQICLSKYQHSIGSKCRTCDGLVPQASLGKYCVRFGFEICQFCSATCLDKFKKSLKNCTYCQKDISKNNEGFLAPVGDNEQFKDFCSQNCMKKYDTCINPKRKTKIEQCSVCNNKKAVQVELFLDERVISFCSNPCFSAFKFVNNIMPDKCNLCTKYFERKSTEHFTIYNDNVAQIFCGKICMNMFITQNRKIVFCEWCRVKKYNFDMIEKCGGQTSESMVMCSLNCLLLFGISVNRITKQKQKCDNCKQEKTPQYHLTMSDSSMRNFCTYQCVMQFQSQFSSAPLTLDDNGHSNENIQYQEGNQGSLPFPTGLPKRIKSNVSAVQIPMSSESTMPIIANITSLASEAARKRIRARSKTNAETSYPTAGSMPQTHLIDSPTLQPKAPSNFTMPKVKVSKRTIGTPAMEPANKTFVVELPAEPKLMANMTTQCMPLTDTIGVTCKPESCDSEIQTNDDVKSKKLIPVPIPIYIPQPMQGLPIPRPIPVPFFFPIPIPIFIPTTKNSAEGIMKEIKKIQDKMPADPYEAELLMMAELVASDKKKEEESDDENNDVAYNNENPYGEDVLQMALKMATEYDEPSSVDLDTSMAANNDGSNMIYHQMQINQRLGRGKKRTNPTNIMSRENNIQPTIKKRRPSENPVVAPSPNIPIEKPDANMCLKFTFGVNAWKQWVLTKNSDLEKSSIRRKPFKSELLQMTADELNYSLCLFVKEVRKPNGTEYAPDTIYYLVLGIQQYLYENGRIDNIFTDPYYERFTDCLDEVARKFSVLYNDSQYIVTRVEEEHLWECKQLGAHSPHVLLSTLMFFNTKHFNLTTVEEHMQLSFSHIMKHWKRNAQGAKQPGSRNVLLRFYPPNTGQDSKKKKVYEQQENEANPLRCPVRLYEFYLSKCPESVKTRNDVFYLQPERSCVPDSPVWYSTQPLSQESLQKMLHRVKMVKEINVALLTT